MVQKNKIFIVWWLIVVLNGFWSLNAYARHSHSSDIKIQLHKVQSSIAKNNRKLSVEERHRANLEGQLRKISQSISYNSEQFRLLEKRKNKQIARLKISRFQLKKAKRDLNDQIERWKKETVTFYEMGKNPRWILFLDQKHPNQFSRMLIYYQAIEKQRELDLQQLHRSLKRLDKLRSQEQHTKQMLHGTLVSLAKSHHDLQSSLLHKRQLIHRLDKSIQSVQVHLKNLLMARNRLRKLLTRVSNSAQTISSLRQHPFFREKGKLRWPVDGRLLYDYGSPRRGTHHSLHWQGVFIRAPAGRYVRAIYSGKVLFANWLRGYGLLMVIDHGDGFMTLYGDTQAIYRKVGSWVHQGEIIASVGESERNGSGLYFGIRHDGRPADPGRWCRGRP